MLPNGSVSPSARLFSPGSDQAAATKSRLNTLTLAQLVGSRSVFDAKHGQRRTGLLGASPRRVGTLFSLWETAGQTAALQRRMGRAGAARQPEVTDWSQTGLSNPGWDRSRSLDPSPRPGTQISFTDWKSAHAGTYSNYVTILFCIFNSRFYLYSTISHSFSVQFLSQANKTMERLFACVCKYFSTYMIS